MYHAYVRALEPSREFVQITRIAKKKLRELHGAMVDLIAVMNQPQRDQALLAEAGLSLDRALFQLLVGIERFGPIGVVELADRAGRDYTTVSRQVAKLESLGLIERRPSPADRRVHEAVITDKGRQMTDALDAARQRLAAPILANWSEEDFDDLVRLMRRFVDDLMASSGGTEKP
ncbi:MarR family transcriptional regulator [Sorangium cellulosum]|uniref:MarR family transcriptional regulator n=1 Tax=Sorangium cellulosum TaxID=56 RepID=A0A150U2Q3_SORCE|nr:MarR family transcriptional regulator [Sorangium cellulosum]